ncbi:protein cordon-bleu isoform X5 [Dermochelys coriacea]|uniref:protein cordon-bleu isoform X5 n=1 Tax=Dermochelys coriacea TaxID=27794 RepID=UPI0018E7A206|nr:protein cordon-bleu isoform X5 [Dermochelys coriacea]XP_038248991.1 protein cordon-bleu isoform X5 [Dermochelys coriacea]XP_043364563.1 protein cordon-bleu isoform X5 [Dermochelys coriacea]
METLAQPGANKPPSGRKMKARAPPPPSQSLAASQIQSEQKLVTELGVIPDQSLVTMKENLINRTVDFTVVLPSGVEQKNNVHGSKAVMDLLVDLCSRYHLNPAHHTLELKACGMQPLSYKPNTLVGALDVQTVLLKEKVPEGKTKRPPPRIPEKSVRLVVNYLKTHKAVVRVSPEVPLHSIIPAICEKCEVSPDHVVLLRDNITGEELELTKSLDELGIKELYAWDRKRETSQNSSLSNDATEKEKRGFLGFFKVNKRSSKGFATAPNSPSVNSRSITLGPSLSLGNISGMTANPEIKKRRAPPPPVAAPLLQSMETSGMAKTAIQIPQGASQNDLQKKKRRAPPPPTPPAPVMPNRTEEKEDKRKSTMGNGRQVPQKPPRGNIRGPPQLVIPPPPPYPPPDTDIVDPTDYYSEAPDVTAPTNVVPQQSLQLTHDNIYVVDDMVLELSEVEETTSLSSCFASEDTTEDSGVVSSPSDVVSLNSQNDNMKFKDKPVNGQEDSAERDGIYAAELCSVRNTSCDSNDSGNAHQSSRDEETTAAKNDNEDVFIAARLRQTLTELDEDLEAMEGIHYEADNNSVSSHTNGASSSHFTDADTAQDAAFVVPVTIIDEILNINAVGPTEDEENALLPNADDEDISADSINLGNFTNRNSAGSFDKKHVDGGSLSISMDLIHQQSSDDIFKPLPVEQRREMFESLTSSFEKRNENNLGLENSYKHGVSSEECKPMLISSHLKPKTQIHIAREKTNQFNEQNSQERFLNKMHTELEFKPPSTKTTEEKEDILSPPLWGHRAPSSITSYEPKVGLTTFKVVPPKPEIKYFDRGNSFSTGAIKIDDLGNLMTPNAGKKNTSDISSNETDEPLIRRVKEFWRSNSTGKQSDKSIEHNSKKSVVTVSSKPFNSKSESKPLSLTDAKPIPLQPVTSNVVERHFELERIKPPVPAAQSQVNTSVSPTINQDKTEFPFLRPYKRTSSHYVASAIAKRLDPLMFNTDLIEKHDKEENNHEEKLIKIGAEPLPKGCIIMTKNSPMEIKPAEMRDSYSNIFTCSYKASNSRLTLGDNSAVENKAVNIRLLNQTTPVGFYKRSISVPLTKSFSKDNNTAEGDHSKHSIVDKNTHPLSDQKCEKTDHTNSSSSFTSPDLPTPTSSSSSLLRPTKWHPANNIQTNSLKALSELNITPVNNHVISQRDEKPDSMNKSDVTVQTDIFGPKKKFKPIVQKPVPKDTSLHSTLMEAIQTAGGKEKLRKSSDSMTNGSQKKTSYAEPENEHSALLAAIRGHRGTSGLKKISSSASEELQSFRNAELFLQNKEASQAEHLWIPPPPVLLPPQPPPSSHKSMTAPKLPVTATSNPGEAREALMEAIRSGAGAARLRKVPLLV